MIDLARLAAASLLFTATAACGSVTVAPAGSSKVAGTVVDSTGIPVGGALVRIGDTVSATDAQGHFSLSGAPVPYDVAIVADPTRDAHVYLGMSDLAPTFRLFVDVDPGHLVQNAKVNVTLPSPDTNTLRTALLFEVSTDKLPWQRVSRDPGPLGPMQTWTAGWRGASQVTATLHAFQYQRGPDGGPQHYVGYDTTQVTLANGANVPWTVSWKPPPFGEKVVSVAASASGDSWVWDSLVTMQTSAQGWGGLLARQYLASPAASVVVPDLPGASFGIGLDAGNQDWAWSASVTGLAAGATGPTLQLAAAPTLLSPTSATLSFGIGSTVKWTGGGPGTAYFTLTPWELGTGPSVFLFGGDGSAQVPDLSSVGVTLPHGVAYNAEFHIEGSAPSVDDLAAQGPYVDPSKRPSIQGQGQSILVAAP